MCGNAKLIAGVRSAKQFLSFASGAPFQPAVTLALNSQQAWVEQSRRSLQSRRDRLAAGLADIGFDAHHTSGTFFLAQTPRRSASTTVGLSAPNCRTVPV